MTTVVTEKFLELTELYKLDIGFLIPCDSNSDPRFNFSLLYNSSLKQAMKMDFLDLIHRIVQTT